MNKTARLSWHTPIEVRVRKTPPILFSGDITSIPDGPGMYVFAQPIGSRLLPLYIGLARSLRRRVKEHLRSKRLIIGLSSSDRGKTVYVYATFHCLDVEFAARLLGSFEAALIARAVKVGGATLNTHKKKVAVAMEDERCTLFNQGHVAPLSWWCPSKMTAPLLPPRRRGRPLTTAGA